MDVVEVKETVCLEVKVLHDISVNNGYGKTTHVVVFKNIHADETYYWVTQSIPGFGVDDTYYIKAQMHDNNRLSYVRKIEAIPAAGSKSEQSSLDAMDMVLGLV